MGEPNRMTFQSGSTTAPLVVEAFGQLVRVPGVPPVHIGTAHDGEPAGAPGNTAGS
jgi:hypothetical protein